MNHLIIEQNNTIGNPEVVTSDIIDKVYKTDVNNTLDGTSNVKGYLQCSRAYEDAVAYLTNKYPDLHINVTGGLYIRFKDSAMQAACAKWGDGTGLTKTQAANVTDLGSFQENTSIVSFDELKYFTSITSIGGWAFNNATKLKSIDLSNIVTLGAQCFMGCTSLETVNLSSKFTTVENWYGCFSGCTSLKDVGDVSGLTQMYTELFNNCNSLLSVNMSNKCTYIGSNTFSECWVLSSVGDTSRVTSIDQGGFYHCTALTTLSFPECLSIGQESFRRGSLTNIEFGKLTTAVGYAQFGQCANLTQITGLTNVTSVGQEFCVECTKLISVDLGQACTSIGNYAFYQCTNLVSVGDTSGVTTINGNAFDGCTKLLSLDTSNVITINGERACTGCSSLTSVDLRNCTNIGDDTFLNCSSLSLDLNLKVLTICNKGVFSRCSSLSSVHLYNVTKIDKWSFDYCTSLRYIRIDATAVPTLVDINAFDKDTCNFYVTDSLVDSYKSATNWSAYASRIFSLTQFAIDFPNG